MTASPLSNKTETHSNNITKEEIREMSLSPSNRPHWPQRRDNNSQQAPLECLNTPSPSPSSSIKHMRASISSSYGSFSPLGLSPADIVGSPMNILQQLRQQCLALESVWSETGLLYATPHSQPQPATPSKQTASHQALISQTSGDEDEDISSHIEPLQEVLVILKDTVMREKENLADLRRSCVERMSEISRLKKLLGSDSSYARAEDEDNVSDAIPMTDLISAIKELDLDIALLKDSIKDRSNTVNELRSDLKDLQTALGETEHTRIPEIPEAAYSMETITMYRDTVEDFLNMKMDRLTKLHERACKIMNLTKLLSISEDRDPIFSKYNDSDHPILPALENLSTQLLSSHVNLQQPLTCHISCFKHCESLCADLEKEVANRQDYLQFRKNEIHLLWADLEIEESKRVILPDWNNSIYPILGKELLELYDKEYQKLLAGVQDRRREMLNATLAKIRKLWDDCHTSEAERALFLASVNQDVIERNTLDAAKNELCRLEETWTKYHEIFSIIKDRYTLIQKMLEFEKTASDPSRLFQSSFRLLQEEQFRKTCLPRLMKMEIKLGAMIQDVEKESGKDFLFKGERFLSLMDREISHRFVNENVFGYCPNMSSSSSTSSSLLDSHSMPTSDKDTNSRSSKNLNRTNTTTSVGKTRPSPKFTKNTSANSNQINTTRNVLGKLTTYKDPSNSKINRSLTTPPKKIASREE